MFNENFSGMKVAVYKPVYSLESSYEREEVLLEHIHELSLDSTESRSRSRTACPHRSVISLLIITQYLMWHTLLWSVLKSVQKLLQKHTSLLLTLTTISQWSIVVVGVVVVTIYMTQSSKDFSWIQIFCVYIKKQLYMYILCMEPPSWVERLHTWLETHLDGFSPASDRSDWEPYRSLILSPTNTSLHKLYNSNTKPPMYANSRLLIIPQCRQAQLCSSSTTA